MLVVGPGFVGANRVRAGGESGIQRDNVCTYKGRAPLKTLEHRARPQRFHRIGVREPPGRQEARQPCNRGQHDRHDTDC